MEGKGNLLLTGQLGDVMKESAHAASHTPGPARRLGIDPARFEKTDIHIHVPAGAIPRTALRGITMATALVWLHGRKVRRDVAMTARSPARQSAAHSGLKEKVLAATAPASPLRLPSKTRRTWTRSQKVRAAGAHTVENLDSVLQVALRPPQTSRKQKQNAENRTDRRSPPRRQAHTQHSAS